MPAQTENGFTAAKRLRDKGAMTMAERNAKVPLGRAGSAWDVANPALFLASDEAAFITGECILVDGGRTHNRI